MDLSLERQSIGLSGCLQKVLPSQPKRYRWLTVRYVLRISAGAPCSVIGQTSISLRCQQGEGVRVIAQRATHPSTSSIREDELEGRSSPSLVDEAEAAARSGGRRSPRGASCPTAHAVSPGVAWHTVVQDVLKGVTVSRPVSGILSSGPFPGSGLVTIHLVRSTWGEMGGPPLPRFDLAPGGVCRAARVTPGAGALLPHRFTLTCGGRPGHPARTPIGGLFSVALSCGSPRLAVSQHPALRSPDFPRPGRRPRGHRLAAVTRPAHHHQPLSRRSGQRHDPLFT